MNTARATPIWFIALGLFGLYTIEFGVVGILPAIMERFHVGTAQAGMLVGAFAFVIALFGPFMVLILSNRNRKQVLVLCLLIFAGCSALSAFTDHFYVLLALRVIPALFHPVFFSFAFVAVASLYPEEQRANASAKAFIGTSMGMVLGVPLTTYIADQFSYEASFLFCAIVNGIAAAGIAVILPKTPAAPRVKYREQLSILRKIPLWLSIGAATFLFSAMFAVYSYSAEFLGQVMGLQERILSIMLVVFGVGGVAGNLLAGKLLGMNRLRTTLIQPFVLAIAYFLLDSGITSLVPITAVMLLWGAAHTSGLIVTQTLLTSEASEAPEFVNALYISFINLGVSIGSAVGGRFIAAAGIEGSLEGGILFIALTLVCIVSNIWVKRRV